MPKETIRDKTNAELWAEVRWHPDSGDGSGHVQIATLHSDETAKRAILDGTNGWFADLDRDQVNRLIRVLRRARDSAYGTDA